MPDQTVSLNVNRINNGNVPGGFTQCQNNTDYCYKYSGGNPQSGDPAGSFNFTHGSGAKSVLVQLQGSNGFIINNISVIYETSNSPHDLTPAANPNGTWTITDTDVDVEEGHFLIFVNDNNQAPPVTGIECDPRWRNV